MDPTLLFTIIVLGLCGLGLSWFAGSDAPYVPTKMKFLKTSFKNFIFVGT